MPDSSGFADAPVTRALLFYLVAASLVVSIADVKDLVDLRIGGSVLAVGEREEPGRWFWWVLGCVWRLVIWQVGVQSSLSVFYTFYHLSPSVYLLNDLKRAVIICVRVTIQ